MIRAAAAALALLAALAGCAGYDGRSLVPGQASSADVDKAMGPAADKRVVAGETILWYPRLPSGRVSYAARIGKDDKLIAVEQRLTRENLEKLRPGVSREGDVRDLLGPPSHVNLYPDRHRDVWTYEAQGIQPQLMLVQMSPDGVVRETYMIDDPAMQAQDGSQ